MPHILIVDDDPTLRKMFRRALRDVADISEADGGGDALERIRKERFDVILLDMHMPGVDGFSVLDALNETGSPNFGTPTYVVTADTTPALRNRATQLGAACVVTKPVPLATLVSFVKSTIATGQLKRTIAPGSR